MSQYQWKCATKPFDTRRKKKLESRTSNVGLKRRRIANKPNAEELIINYSLALNHRLRVQFDPDNRCLSVGFAGDLAVYEIQTSAMKFRFCLNAK